MSYRYSKYIALFSTMVTHCSGRRHHHHVELCSVLCFEHALHCKAAQATSNFLSKGIINSFFKSRSCAFSDITSTEQEIQDSEVLWL